MQIEAPPPSVLFEVGLAVQLDSAWTLQRIMNDDHLAFFWKIYRFNVTNGPEEPNLLSGRNNPHDVHILKEINFIRNEKVGYTSRPHT